MRNEIAAADRRFEVRRAITTWRRAGIVDAAAESTLAATCADDRIRTSRVFRALFFVFTWFGFSTAYGFGMAFLAAAGMSWDRGTSFAILHMIAGAAMLVAAEVLTGARRLRRFGIEEACAWIGWSYLLGGGLWGLSKELALDFSSLVTLGAWAAAALATLVAWRWATPGMGVAAAGALFVALSQLPANHLLWLLVGGVVAAPLALLATAPHISPEHRRRFSEAFVVVVAMFYFAVHIAVVEAGLFTHFRRHDGLLSGGSSGVPWAFVALSPWAMVAVPAGLLLVGLRRRFRPAIDLGLLLAGVTAVSLANRWDLAPAWLELLIAGALIVAFALAVERYLSRRVGAEWRGLTALALAQDRGSAQTLEVAATLAAFAPAARAVEPESFDGAGGDFGGGGASGRF